MVKAGFVAFVKKYVKKTSILLCLCFQIDMGAEIMGRQLKMKLLFVLGVLLLLGIGGIYWYLAVYTKTPEYSMQMIQNAMERHDKAKFHKYVDIDLVLDGAYDDLVLGLMDAGQPMSQETKAAVGDIVKVMKAPLITSFKTAIDQYVETGSWDGVETEDGMSEDSMDFHQALLKSGLKDACLRGIEGIVKEAGTKEAIANVKVFQSEANAEFVLEVLLSQGKDGTWRVTGIRNFHDFVVFVGEARKAELTKYLEETADIMAKHDKSMRDADFDFQRIMAAGSLGKQGTREELKKLMEDTVAKDWKARRDELETVMVPDEAQSLQRLRLRICDLHIGYAEGYAAWLDDKKAATLREAESKIKQARTLEQEARFLAKRMGGSPNDI